MKETKSTFLDSDKQFFLHLQEIVEAHCTECVAQKARRKVEAKVKKEAEKWRIAEKKKKLEYLQQLQDEMLEEEAALLEKTEESQVAGSKCKEIAAGDKKEQWPSKKAKEKQPEKYCRGITVKMGGANPCERCVSAKQDYLVHLSR